MDESKVSAIFTAAATATSWQRTVLGLCAKVANGGCDWIVALPKEGEGKAYIAGSCGYGGETATFIEATWGETIPIVDAAMAATRA